MAATLLGFIPLRPTPNLMFNIFFVMVLMTPSALLCALADIYEFYPIRGRFGNYRLENFLDAYLITLPLGIPSYLMVGMWLRDRRINKLVAFVMSRREKILYDHFYTIHNGTAPESVYKLHIRYSDRVDEDCNICLQPLNQVDHDRECIIKCGHRFHHSCLRQWELNQFHTCWYDPYSCPLCKQEYDWKEKWQFDADLWSKYQ